MSTTPIDRTTLLVDRTTLLAEASAIEAADGWWAVRHLAAVLGCHKASIYKDAGLAALRESTPAGPGWAPRRVRALLKLRSAHTAAPARRRRKAS